MIHNIKGIITFQNPLTEEITDLLTESIHKDIFFPDEYNMHIPQQETDISNIQGFLNFIHKIIKEEKNDIQKGFFEYSNEYYKGEYIFHNETWNHYPAVPLSQITTKDLINELIRRKTEETKENELFVKGYVYFPTNAVTAKEAWQELNSACEMAGINSDNLAEAITLRNTDGEDIDHYTY